jgi:MFS family permease
MAPRWRLLMVLTAARTTMGIQFQSVVSVYPALASEISLGYGELGFLVGLYFLPGAFIALPAGAAGQRFGDKRMVLLGLFLMAAGAVLMCFASSVGWLSTCRLVSGVGAVLLNVAMSKMITDWFAGKEIALAMSIFVNSFPIGIGLALLGYAWSLPVLGWRAGMLACGVVVAAAFLLVLLAGAKHANDRATSLQAAAPAVRLGRRELLLVCLAGAIWGLYNGGFSVMISFAPNALQSSGIAAAEAATVVALATWAVVLSIQAGGVLAQKWATAGALMVVGLAGWAACLVVAAIFPSLAAAAIVLAGCIMGVPVGAILALPAQVLHPSQRAIGMGIFYVWLYLGHGLLPPAAGWLQDWAGAPSAALLIVAAIAVIALVAYRAFLQLSRAKRTGDPQSAVTSDGLR